MSLGFGIEKLGLLVLRFPRIAALFVIAFTIFCGFGVPKLSSDAALSELFRADTKAFREYKQLSDKFPTSEFDILAVVESDNLHDREKLETIRTLHLDLQLVDAVDGILSLFSMRGTPEGDGLPPPMFPADLPEGEAFDKLMAEAEAHPLIGDKLISKRDSKSQIALLVISVDPKIADNEGLKNTIEEIEKLAHEIIDPTGMTVQLAGAPVQQLEVRQALKQDRLVFNSLGFLTGFAICFAFFRRPKLVTMAVLCPLLSVVWGLGLLGHMDVRLNTFLNAIPPLVMVIALSDALHMVYSIRRQLRQGKTRDEAARHAILTVGPACLLTSLTTSVAMASLALTDSAVIRTFGLSAALATAIAFVVIIIIIPMLTTLWLTEDEEKSFQETEKTGKNKILKFIEDGCSFIAQRIRHLAYPLAALGLVLLVTFSYMYLQLEPRYKLADQLPDNKQANAASDTVDEKLSGAVPLHIMIKWKEGETIEDKRVLEAIGDAHALMESTEGVGNVWSPETLNRWLQDNMSIDDSISVAKYIRMMPIHLSKRFVNEKENAMVVTGRLPSLDAEDTVPILNKVDKDLDAIRAKYPDYEFYVTGLASLSSIQASSMIRQLNQSLIVAVVVVMILIGIAFRSFEATALSVFPNLFPIVAAGALLYLGGAGLEYASVIGLTVAFGLAVDDTIHFLNRLHLERQRSSTLVKAVEQTIEHIGPVLILTTIVLVIGMSVTILSELPPMRLFGELSMTMLTAAVLADIFFLPALIITVKKMFGSKEKDESPVTPS